MLRGLDAYAVQTVQKIKPHIIYHYLRKTHSFPRLTFKFPFVEAASRAHIFCKLCALQ